MKKYGGSFIADGNAVNLDIGSVPDHFRAWVALGGTVLVMEWYKSIAANVTASGQYGITDTGGTKSLNASAAAGFAEYSTKVLKAILPAPDGNGERAATIYGSFTDAKADSVTPTARSTSVVGTVIRPTTANGFLYECTTQGGSMAALTEPDPWSTVVGATTSDGSNTWTTRTEKLKNVGAAGITVGASIGTDGDEWTYEAEIYDSDAPERDAVSFDPVGKYQND